MEQLVALPEVLPDVPLLTVGLGVDKAQAYIIHLIKNEKVDGKKKAFGPGILQDLHSRVFFFYPPLAGEFRGDDETRIMGRKVAKADELKDRVYLFERWLEDEVDTLKQNPEDLEGALRVAAGAHHAIASELQAFPDGNKRVARMLVNGILVLNTREGMFYNMYVTPIPSMRDQIDEEELRRQLESGRTPKLSPYLQAIESVNDTWTLNPFEVFLATRWVGSINLLLKQLKGKYSRNGKAEDWKRNLNKTERSIVEKIEERKRRLQQFIEDDIQGRRPRDPVPNFFTRELGRHG